ncbi:hypothetical protein Tco_0773558, partial [Tanacetum coccineum]
MCPCGSMMLSTRALEFSIFESKTASIRNLRYMTKEGYMDDSCKLELAWMMWMVPVMPRLTWSDKVVMQLSLELKVMMDVL